MKVKIRKLMLTRTTRTSLVRLGAACACLTGVIFSCPILAQAVSDQPAVKAEVPVLKPDVPKLDTTPPPQPRTLKGGVQHRETAMTDAPKKLSSGVFDVFKKKKTAKLNGQTAAAAPNSLLKSGATQGAARAPLTATVPNGVGIIGVKFLLTLGHMPVINRVFPGTPAFSEGLRSQDIIVAVDGVPTLGLSKESVYGLIVGKPDTDVTISIRRGTEFICKTMKRMDFNDIPDPMVRQDYLMSI